MTQSERIKTLRRKIGLKQTEFASLLGVSSVTISRWENGQVAPTNMALANIEKLESEKGIMSSEKLRNAVVNTLLRADKKDWDRLEAYLAKDGSGHGRFWQEVLREVRQAMATIKEEV